MQKPNHDKDFLQICSSLNSTPRLLLHVCCAPCATYCLTQLIQRFDVTLYYSNDNIMPQEEWHKRLNELQRLTDIINGGGFTAQPIAPVKLTHTQYSPQRFLQAASGLESQPEGGARCEQCFVLRLKDAADYASQNGFDYLATTLTISPYKNSQLLNDIGYSLQNEQLKWLPSDFKKRDGYRQSIRLCEQYGIYRQHYCGCCFSLAEQISKLQ